MAANVRPDRRATLTTFPLPPQTIFALSSGRPPAAIAVVRISGPQAGPALATLAGRLPPPRRATLAWLRDRDGIALDRALVLWAPGPRTATGEDLAELHLHGGQAVVTAMLTVLSAMPGLCAAEPGAFTRRAFENGRIDLTEAEGLADLLAAETESQRRAALATAGGGLSRAIERWRTEVLALSAALEAALDFADEDDVPDRLIDDLAHRATILSHEINILIDAPRAERLRDGVRIVLAGPPNAGKSTLLNALAGHDAAIVSDEPGTTRDVIAVPVALGGAPMVLTDTAGLRAAAGVIEAIGIARAEAQIAEADILLWLGDPATCPDHPRVIVIHAQADRPGRAEPSAGAVLAVSAVTGIGMTALVDRLIAEARSVLPQPDALALNRRQAEAARDVADALVAPGSHDPLILAENFRVARAALDRMTGRAGTEDMLDSLFARFCIGK